MLQSQGFVRAERILAPALLTMLACALAARRGLFMNPDAWAYWEGAYSVLHGNGYTYIDGGAIQAFPALFSIFLAVISSLFGECCGAALILSYLLTSIACATAWCAVAHALEGLSFERRRRSTLWIGAAFFAAYTAHVNLDIRAEWLTRAMLPLALLCVLRRDARPKHEALLLVALAVGALCKNSFLAYLPGVAAAHWSLHKRPWIAGGVLVLPLAASLIMRGAFDQSASHAMHEDAYGARFLAGMGSGWSALGKAMVVEHLTPIVAIAACCALYTARIRAAIALILSAYTVSLAAMMAALQVADGFDRRFMQTSACLLFAYSMPALRVRGRLRGAPAVVVLAVFVPAAAKSTRSLWTACDATSVDARVESTTRLVGSGAHAGPNSVYPPNFPWISRRAGEGMRAGAERRSR